MSVKRFKFVSPGVFINEIDNSQLPRDREPVGPCVVGRLPKGPSNRPVTVASFSEFVEIFGNPIAGGRGGDIWRDGNTLSPTYAAYAAQAFLRNSSPVTVVRVLGEADPSAIAGGEAGWKVSKNHAGAKKGPVAIGGAYGLILFSSGSAQVTPNGHILGAPIPLAASSRGQTSITGSLAAVWYFDQGAIELSGAMAHSEVEINRLKNAGDTATERTDIAANAMAIKPSTSGQFEFQALLYDKSNRAKKLTFNFDRDSDKYIRKVFNTNPTLLGASSTVSDQRGYFLGETFDRHLKDLHATSLDQGSPSADSTLLGAIVALRQGSSADFGLNQKSTQPSYSPWFIGQDLTDNTAAFDANKQQKLFRLVALDDGEWSSKNIKVTIENHKAAPIEGEYGSFDLVLRYTRDNDASRQVLETYGNVNLNPNSRNYIAARIGDTHQTWDAAEQRYRVYGTFPNQSRFVRVVMNDDVDQGLTDTNLLPFGFIGPPRWKNVNFDKVTSTAAQFAGTTTLTFGGVPAADETIVIISTDGTSKTYTAKASESLANRFFNRNGTAAEAATSLQDCINNADGHAGKITAVATGTSLVLTQATKGVAGNTTLTSGLANVTIANSNKFAGGSPAGFITGSVLHTTGGLSLSLSAEDTTTADFKGSIISLSADTTSPINTADLFNSFGTGSTAARPEIAGLGDKALAKVIFPTFALRSGSADDGLSDQKRACFGVSTARTPSTTRFDESYLDLVAGPKGIAADVYDASSTTEIPFIFTLDDVVASNVVPASVTTAFYQSGSRQLGISYSAARSSYTDLIDSGFTGFTAPMYGGYDGLNIKEREPFGNHVLTAPNTFKGNYANASLKRALDSVADPEVVEINMLSVPGVRNPLITDRVIEICEERADALGVVDIENGGYVPSTETTDSFASRINAASVQAAVTSIKSRGINSSYACAFFPWVKIFDEVNAQQVWVPPSVAAIGTFASSERNSELWFAPAGFTRGGLSEGAAGLPVLGVSQRLSSKDRDRLYDVNINPIAQFPAEGIVIFGQKTLQITPSALDRINVRRLMIFVKKQVSIIASRLLFDQNVQSTWNRFRGQVEPFLDGVKSRLGLTDFKVILDETTTTSDLIDRNIMYAKIFLKPARAIEFIAIDFSITNSGASFDD